MTTFEPGASDVFTHGLRAQAARDGVAREDPRADHHRRVRGVRAARDRRDHDVAVVELERLAVERHARRRAAARERARRLRAVRSAAADARAGAGRVARARRWRAGPRPGRTPRPPRRARRPGRRRWARSRASARLNASWALAQSDAVLRALRAGEARLDRAEVELERVRERRLLGLLVVPQALLAGVGLDERDLLGGCGRTAPGSGASRRRSGRSRRSSRTPATCCRSSRGRRSAAPRRRGRRTRRTSPRRRARAGAR